MQASFPKVGSTSIKIFTLPKFSLPLLPLFVFVALVVYIVVVLASEPSVNVVPCCSDPVASCSGSVVIVAPCSADVAVDASVLAAVVAVDGSCVAATVVVVAAVVVDVELVSSADSIPVQKAYLPDATVALKDKHFHDIHL